MAKITFGKLAQMVENGFNEIGERFEQADSPLKGVNRRLYEIDTEIRYVKAELTEVKHDIVQIRENTIPPLEFEYLSGSVEYFEKKLGMKSGK